MRVFLLLIILSVLAYADTANGPDTSSLIKVHPPKTPTLKLPNSLENQKNIIPAPQISMPKLTNSAQNITVPKENSIINVPPNKKEIFSSNEIIVLFEKGRFRPSNINHNGKATLIFVNLNQKPIALIIEQIKPIEWQRNLTSEIKVEKPFELYKELPFAVITELKLSSGNYEFRDAMSGAKGTIQIKEGE